MDDARSVGYLPRCSEGNGRKRATQDDEADMHQSIGVCREGKKGEKSVLSKKYHSVNAVQKSRRYPPAKRYRDVHTGQICRVCPRFLLGYAGHGRGWRQG